MSDINNVIIFKSENSKNIKTDKDNKYENISTKEKERINKIKNENSNKVPIYIMTLELEKGKQEKIKIYSDSDPMQIASNFCRDHNLDYNGLGYLKNKIETLINQNNRHLISKEKEKSNHHPYKSANNLFQINKNDDYPNYNNNIYLEITNDKNNKKKYDLTSPKQNKKNKINSFNKERHFNLNNKSSSKKSHKCKARIQSIQNSDKIFDKIYSEIKNNQNEKKYNSITKENTLANSNNNTINNYSRYKRNRNKQLKLEREKEIFEIKKEINKGKNNKKDKSITRNNSSIKNYRKKNYFNLNQNIKDDLKKVNPKISKILKEYDEKYSFHPSINEKYKTDLTFEQRQAIYKNIYKKRKEKLKNFYLNSKKDEKGNIFFKPKLISKQINEENKTINVNIFNKNYCYWKKYNLDKEELYKKYYENNKNEPTIFAKKQNEKIINEIKIRAFNNLFNDLDGDQDNYINGININVNRIPKSVYIIIEPLLNELKIDNQSLNKEEFLLAMNKLFEDISSIERRTIINIYGNIKKMTKNKSMNINNSFLQEKINKYRYSTPDIFYCNKNKTNPNTNKLAFKHYNKIRLMFDVLYKKENKFYYKENNKSKKEEIKKGVETDDENFSYICNCTFNNYIKKLN
jgi:hypothetical protein